jgi:hypothetical protein
VLEHSSHLGLGTQTLSAWDASGVTDRSVFRLEDLLYVLRNDKKKFARAKVSGGGLCERV